MSEAAIIFPHQLFEDNPVIAKGREIYLLEEYLFFRQYKFHQQKLLLHRATMKGYEDFLGTKKLNVNYIDAADAMSDIRQLLTAVSQKGIDTIHYADTVDNWLEKRIAVAGKAARIKLVKYPSPNFLNQQGELDDFFTKKKNYSQTDFYIQQRKKRKLLLEKEGKPVGGKWTYDADNRLKFPKTEIIPVINFPKENNYVKEARHYVNEFFPDNYGSVTSFQYPVNFREAERWLDDFLKTRFSKFGNYEDAMLKEEGILYHSVLTPMLNIGLLNPQQIIDKTLEAVRELDIPLNSAEGFIRQVVGWREFIRIVYEREGSSQRTKNFWGFTRKIPASFWKGNTGIHPVDTVIRRTLQTGYAHHIERLMVLGNFMLLCEFDPDEVYRWFMELFADSYDWVMVPNVYGMTQFADGGLVSTKPYISGSNYLMKMGNWDKGPWQQVWDGLFWRFMHTHRDFFLKNPRLSMLIRTFDRMPAEKRNAQLATAEKFLAELNQ